MLVIDIDMIAENIAREIGERFGHKVDPTPFDENRTRGGNLPFSLPIEQTFGIFDMIMKDAHIRARAGVVESQEEGEHISVFTALHYTHHSGGTNGSNVGTFWFRKDGSLIGFRAG